MFAPVLNVAILIAPIIVASAPIVVVTVAEFVLLRMLAIYGRWSGRRFIVGFIMFLAARLVRLMGAGLKICILTGWFAAPDKTILPKLFWRYQQPLMDKPRRIISAKN